MFVPPGDAVALADAVQRLLADAAARNRMEIRRRGSLAEVLYRGIQRTL